jgi:hypothetical protein
MTVRKARQWQIDSAIFRDACLAQLMPESKIYAIANIGR